MRASSRTLEWTGSFELAPDFGSVSTIESDDRFLRFEDSNDEIEHGRQSYIDFSAPARRSLIMSLSSCPIECEKFLKEEQFAEIFIDKIITEARAICQEHFDTKNVIVHEDESNDTSSSSSSSFYEVTWPKINEFSVEIGFEKIDQFLDFWYQEEAWMYCINYIGLNKDEISDYHNYEVIFSIPCKQYPICQATVSVYFTIEVSKVKPPYCLVDVTFQYEGSHLVHTPDKYPYHESWLFNVIDAKIKLFRQLTF